MRKRYPLLLASALVAGSVLLLGARYGRSSGVATSPEIPLSLSKAAPKGSDKESQHHAAIAGLDILRMTMDDKEAVAPLPNARSARLTLRPDLQRTALSLMASHHLPEASVVMMDVGSGQVLVYASHVEKGPQRDLCAEASAPAASVFKVVTGAALVAHAHLGGQTKQCYSGGGVERIVASDLVDDAPRDKWCATLSQAMGRSLNTVFARLAQKHLEPRTLEGMARAFGFGEAIAFDIPVQQSLLQIPQSDPLEFARTAAGFWNTTLSPVQAALLSTIVARGGEWIRPSLVREVLDGEGAVVFAPSPPSPGKRVITKEAATELTTMMEHTVTDGTSFRAFHDTKGKSFLPNVPVAGKTGTLSEPASGRLFTWFSGFAPSHKTSLNDVSPVSIAVLVVNHPTWQVKANVIARDMLRAYFAGENVQAVTRPSPTPVARRKR